MPRGNGQRQRTRQPHPQGLADQYPQAAPAKKSLYADWRNLNGPQPKKVALRIPGAEKGYAQAAGSHSIEQAMRGSGQEKQEHQPPGRWPAGALGQLPDGRARSSYHGSGQQRVCEPPVAPQAVVRHPKSVADGVGIGQGGAASGSYPVRPMVAVGKQELAQSCTQSSVAKCGSHQIAD